MILGDLLDRWRKEAAQLQRRGLVDAAALMLSLSDELEVAVREINAGTVNLVEAAKLSGFSAQYLGRCVKKGKIRNAGRPNAPRIYLSDLPRKPGCAPPDASVPVVDLHQRRRGGREAAQVGGSVRLHRRNLET